MSDAGLQPLLEGHPAPGEKRRFAANTLLNGMAQSASMFASLIFMPMLVSSFGITHYGLFMLASSVTAYASLADFGVGTALTKMVAERYSTGDREDLPRVVSSALLFYLGIGVVVALAMSAVALLAGSIFRVDAGDGSVMRNMLLVGAGFQLVYWPASTARHVLAGVQRYDVIARIGMLTTVLSIAATIAVIVTGEGPLLLIGLQGVVMSIAGAVSIAAAVRASGIRRLAPASGLMHLGAIFSFSWAIFVVQLSDALFYSQTDRIVLGVMAGAAAVGLYEAAAKFNVLVTYVSGLTVVAVLPLAAGMAAQGREASLRSLFVRGTKYIAALVAPVALTLAVLAEPIVRAWLGSAFSGQGTVAAVLVLPHVAVSLGIMGDSIVVSRGRIARRIPYIIGQTVLNVVLSVILVPHYGVLGVAVGTAVAHLVDFPLHMRFLLKETGVPLAEWVRRVIRPVYPQLLVPLGLGLALRSSALSDTLPGLAVLALMMLVAYWVVVYATGLERDERIDLRQIALSLIRPNGS